jgi:hypothetical protein
LFSRRGLMLCVCFFFVTHPERSCHATSISLCSETKPDAQARLVGSSILIVIANLKTIKIYHYHGTHS